MIDWFLILAPLLLFPVVLLFAFVGCTGTFVASNEPMLSLSLISSMHLPIPSLVVFTWESPDGPDQGIPGGPRPDPVEVDGDQYWEFEYVIQLPQQGQWTITCAVWTEDGERERRWQSVPMPFDQPAHGWQHVMFELTHDEANDEFEVVNRPYPPSG